MLLLDDPSIDDDYSLIRGVRPDWLISEDGVVRLSSAAFKHSTRETSCFIAEEVGGIAGFNAAIRPLIEAELSASLRGTAMVTAQLVRSLGFWIERRPDEFHGRSAHVVVCAPASMARSQYDKLAKQLSRSAVFIADQHS